MEVFAGSANQKCIIHSFSDPVVAMVTKIMKNKEIVDSRLRLQSCCHLANYWNARNSRLQTWCE